MDNNSPGIQVVRRTFSLIPFSDTVWRTIDIGTYLRKSKDPTPAEEYYIRLANNHLGFLIGNEYPTDFCFFHILYGSNTFWVNAMFTPSCHATGYEDYMQPKFFELVRNFSCKKIGWLSHRKGHSRRNIPGMKLPYKVTSFSNDFHQYEMEI